MRRSLCSAWRSASTAGLLVTAAVAGALSIAGPFERVQISSDPAVWIDPQWTGGDFYDVNVLIRPDCASRPVRLLFPTVTLVQDSATSTPARPGTVTARGAMALTYDGPALPAVYLPRLVRTVSDDFSTTSGTTGRQSGWSDYVDLAPGRTTWFLLRFPLPPMELDQRLRPDPKSVPERFTIRLDALDLGCSVPVTLRRSLPLKGREQLLKLGPRAMRRQECLRDLRAFFPTGSPLALPV